MLLRKRSLVIIIHYIFTPECEKSQSWKNDEVPYKKISIRINARTGIGAFETQYSKDAKCAISYYPAPLCPWYFPAKETRPKLSHDMRPCKIYTGNTSDLMSSKNAAYTYMSLQGSGFAFSRCVMHFTRSTSCAASEKSARFCNEHQKHLTTHFISQPKQLRMYHVLEVMSIITTDSLNKNNTYNNVCITTIKKVE